jgi:hypothetical protein
MVGCCKHGNELSYSAEGTELHSVSQYQFLMNYCSTELRVINVARVFNSGGPPVTLNLPPVPRPPVGKEACLTELR